MNRPIYAIGDTHGHLDQLLEQIALIESDGGKDARIVFLGDYVDRGPDSRGVIEHLARGLVEGRNWICLKGNHDRMFEWFLEDELRHDPHLWMGYHWLHDRIGGVATLASYGIDVPSDIRFEDLHAKAKAAVPQGHIAFLRGLKPYFQENELLFVHAGLRPGVALEDQSEDDLVWIRDGFLEHRGSFPWLVVHGHTALEQPVHFGNRVDLDGGAAYGRALRAAVFEGADVELLSPTGREPMVRDS